MIRLSNSLCSSAIHSSRISHLHQKCFLSNPGSYVRSLHQLTSHKWKSGSWSTNGYARSTPQGPSRWQSLLDQNPSNLIVRNFHKQVFKKTLVAKYQKQDKVDSHYDLVYKGGATTYARWGFGTVEVVGLLCCAAAGVTLLDLPVIYASYDTLIEEPYQFAVFISVNFLICLQILITSRMYVLRIYYSDLEDKFIVIFMGSHPFAIHKAIVEPGGISPVIPGKIKEQCFPWAHDIYTNLSRKMILQTQGFISPSFMNRMLGH